MKRFIIEIAMMTFIGVILVIGIRQISKYQKAIVNETVIPKPEPILLFGIDIDSLDVKEGVIGNGANLSSILSATGMSASTIDQLVKRSEGIFDLKKIKAGHPYTLLLARDSLSTPTHFIYEESPIKYVVFNLRDTLGVSRGEKEVVIKHDTLHGTITSSLWVALKNNNQGPAIALAMEDIFGGVIDFFGLQEGDAFQAIYETMYVENECIGMGKIEAGSFTQSGKRYEAFWYDNDTLGFKGGYYDGQGQSTKRAFLKAPLKFSRISSHFSGNRFHPVLKIFRPHHGVDYSAPIGTSVFTIGDGTVIQVSFQRNGAGRYIKIRHNSTYTTTYMHLNGYADGIREGVRVRQGQVIGYVGKSGLATGPHLDFRVYKSGKPINPLKVESPPAEPIPANLKPLFMQKIALIHKALEKAAKKTE